MENMTLFAMLAKYPSKLKVNVIDNGTTIFQGIVGTMVRYIDAENLARKANVYFSELDTLKATVYLQR